jgi:hypothetical protein
MTGQSDDIIEVFKEHLNSTRSSCGDIAKRIASSQEAARIRPREKNWRSGLKNRFATGKDEADRCNRLASRGQIVRFSHQ